MKNKINNFIIFIVQIALIIGIILFLSKYFAKDVQTIGIKEVQAREITSNFNPCDLAVVDCAGDTEYIEYEGTVKEQIADTAGYECRLNGLGQQCIDDLIAMAWTESRFNCQVIGDNGNSRGCMQIHRKYHPSITVEQAENIVFAVRWTLKRMIKYNYKENREYGIMSHNGTPYTRNTLRYLNSVNNYGKQI